MKPYDIRMERLKKAYIDVKENGVSADFKSMELIKEIGLIGAKQRLNAYKEYLYSIGEKDKINYID